MMTSLGWQRLRRCSAHCSATVTSRVTPRGPNTLNCLQRRSGLMSCVQRHFSVSGRPRRTSRVYFRESSSKGAEASSSILEKKTTCCNKRCPARPVAVWRQSKMLPGLDKQLPGSAERTSTTTTAVRKREADSETLNSGSLEIHFIWAALWERGLKLRTAHCETGCDWSQRR